MSGVDVVVGGVWILLDDAEAATVAVEAAAAAAAAAAAVFLLDFVDIVVAVGTRLSPARGFSRLRLRTGTTPFPV